MKATRDRLPRLADMNAPLGGWFFWKLDEQPDAVCFRCPDCRSNGLLRLHSIKPDGEVNASVVCSCGYHEFVVLDLWPSELQKLAGAMTVTPA